MSPRGCLRGCLLEGHAGRFRIESIALWAARRTVVGMGDSFRLERIALWAARRTVSRMEKESVQLVGELDPEVVDKVLARHAGVLCGPVVYADEPDSVGLDGSRLPVRMQGSRTCIWTVCKACGGSDHDLELSGDFEQLVFEAPGPGGGRRG